MTLLIFFCVELAHDNRDEVELDGSTISYIKMPDPNLLIIPRSKIQLADP